ncbi:putative disease resistance protein RGA4 [Triticum dicoccoides]|uniref:putative disease resistance protein RGA4 n=1 Tax=Triticum dicoccoides TaxID=85692 RepID=UPI001890B660|nr:putative disease resistance protein RGA4 [Triticum dicoccoides]
MALGAFKAIASVFADINACHDFFTWVTPGIVKARHQLLAQDNMASHHQICEVRDQLWQLENDLWKLRTTVAPKMLDLIDRVEWQSHKKPAADLLPHIEDVVYDAEDLLDEFDYYAIKLRVEQSKNSDQVHMEAAFLQFYNSIKEDCGHFNKVNEIQVKLDHLYEQSRDLGFHQAPQRFDRSIRPETCSFSDEPQIFGREKERKQLVQKLGVRAHKRGRADGKERMVELPVLPIVGLGGVGKTTMAQQICNDAKVKLHFDCIIWTCVSDDFDIKRLTREILQHFGKDTPPDTNLNILMTNLATNLKSKKFLLVLDDMWDDILKKGRVVWKRFCKPLENGLQGSVILVTTRSSEVADLVGTMNHNELAGLPDDILWNFFKLQAFGSQSSCNDPELENIGKAILPKLKGSPLAAKTLGRLLNRDINTRHWKYILESELWQLEQDATDILPALRLSYMYLPPHLKRCFSICALYPKDHIFGKEFLVNIWTSHGYVQPQGASFCFDDLANRSFFQRDNVGYSELKSICNKKKLRSLVWYGHSPTNFAAVIDSWFRELLKICVLIFEAFRVRELPESMGSSKHLRYLCLNGCSYTLILPSSIHCLLHLKTIEVGDCEFKSFPQGFSDVISLQKIKSVHLDYNKDHSDRLCLNWLLGGISGEKQVQMMEQLPHWNLQHLIIKDYAGGSCPSWLRPNLLPRLRQLKFISCCNIQNIPFFEPLYHEEMSDNLHHLQELYIDNCNSLTSIGVSAASGSSSSSVGELSSFARLIIIGCGGLFSLDEFLKPDYVPALKTILIQSCPELTSLPANRLHGFSCLNEISIDYCPKLNTQREMILPSSLKNLWLMQCGGIETINFRQLGSSPALKGLSIVDCPDFRSIDVAINVAYFLLSPVDRNTTTFSTG